MTADFADWVDEHSQDHKRRLRTAMFVSLAMHAVLLGIFAVSPPALIAPTPEYLSVDLVAAAPPVQRVTRSPSAPPADSPGNSAGCGARSGSARTLRSGSADRGSARPSASRRNSGPNSRSKARAAEGRRRSEG